MPLKNKNRNKIPNNTVLFQRDGAKSINGIPTDINWCENINNIKL